MKRLSTLTIGLMLAILLAAANATLTAQDPNCDKWCGCGETDQWGTRSGCGSSNGCFWVECTISRCGGDAFNDTCASPDWCENTGGGGGELCA